MRHPAAVLILATVVGSMFANMFESTGLLRAQNRLEVIGEPPPPALPRGTAVVSGRVTDPATDMPVRAARVTAAAGLIGEVTAVTDDSGRYRLSGLAAGPWTITASKGGYVTWQYGQRRPFQRPAPIELTRGQQLTADIPLTRGSAVSGRVADEFGEPLAGLQVRAYRARMQQGHRRLEAVAAADFTDDGGNFRVYGLPPGDYYVAASLRVAPRDSVVSTTYAPTYFPGTGDLADAQRVRLALGGEAVVNFQLLPVRRLRVSGVVSSAAGTPANAYLSLESEATEFGAAVGIGGVTRADGTFTLSDVPPGRYRLTASLRGDGPEETGWAPVTVYTEDVEGTTLVTSRAATLRGAIVADTGGSRPLPGDVAVLAVAARPGGPVLSSGSQIGPQISSQSGSGVNFEITPIGEPFRIVVDGLPQGWAVKDIVVNGGSALDVPVALSAGTEGQARIVLTDRVTELAGAVRTGAAGDVAVVVFPEDSTRWGYRSRYVRLARTDARGRFQIIGLPPSERYLAIATDNLEEGEHQDPDFLSAMQTQAVSFSLAEGEKRNIDVRLVER